MAPPRIASTRSQITGRRSAFNARKTRRERSFDDFFMVEMKPLIGLRGENATVHETSQLGNTRKGKESYWGE